MACDKDVKDDCNLTTLGPYSFHVFVLAGWTMSKMQGKNGKDASMNEKILQGRRKETDVGTGKRKRPTAADVFKTSQEERKAKRARKENTDSPEVLVEAGRTLRSGRKIA
jgi:hypothetical protein